ncbi:hypothetical protein Tco_1044812 [Tanacetum coccineum]|uniref:Retrotransposon gag domain-containing protein n=1 Tax=Tanacetum coccineum TaxID=301880 RepID=A0ABQ5GSY8_9ASTR
MRDRMTLQEIVWIVEEEAYASREAWAHSIGLNPPPSTSGTATTAEYSHSDTAPDMRREMSDMQTKLLAHQEQQRRARQPGPDARIPDHQDASGDADRSEGVVGLTRWIEKMVSVFNISGCTIENQVKFATCTLLGAALTWWNGQIRTLGPEAYSMAWEFVANETEKVDKYISGLPDNIYGNVKSTRPKKLDETIELANDLMD